MLAQRCPRCRQGKMFRGPFTMNDPCPVCGLIFQREEGYFLAAMYVSYLLCVVFLGVGYLLGRWLLRWNDHLLLAALVVLYVPLTPLVFRYSRVVWIYFERAICPSDTSAGSYEKQRRRQLGRRKPGDRPT
jgi:uncharacterized protein (DUF983 family)